MAKHENSPLPYYSRVRDTKGIAQRLGLHYLRQPNLLRQWRRRLAWTAPAVALALALPFVIGIGKTERVFSNGPISHQHAMFANRCKVCHVQAFSVVTRQACLACHEGRPIPPRPSIQRSLFPNRSASACHVEHRGGKLAEVVTGNCTACHASLDSHATGVRLKKAAITAFRPGKHPDFARSHSRRFQAVAPESCDPHAGGRQADPRHAAANAVRGLSRDGHWFTERRSGAGDFRASLPVLP